MSLFQISNLVILPFCKVLVSLLKFHVLSQRKFAISQSLCYSSSFHFAGVAVPTPCQISFRKVIQRGISMSVDINY